MIFYSIKKSESKYEDFTHLYLLRHLNLIIYGIKVQSLILFHSWCGPSKFGGKITIGFRNTL